MMRRTGHTYFCMARFEVLQHAREVGPADNVDPCRSLLGRHDLIRRVHIPRAAVYGLQEPHSHSRHEQPALVGRPRPTDHDGYTLTLRGDGRTVRNADTHALSPRAADALYK